MEEKIFRKNKHGIRNFFSMLWKAKLPYVWILVYIISSFVITKVGISATEYSAELFAGNVDFVSVVMPFLVTTIISLLIGSVSGVLTLLAQARIDRNMRRMVWGKVVKLPFSYYDNSNPKELISRVTTDVSSVSGLIMRVFVGFITSAYTVWQTLARIGSYDYRLMLVLIVVVPINVLIALLLGKMSFGISDIVKTKNAELTEHVAETTDNLLLVKSLGMEEKELNRGMKRVLALYKKTVLNSWIAGLNQPAYAVAGMIQFMLIVLVGRGFYQSGAISLAEWVAYFAFANNIVNILTSYCGDWITFKTSQGATHRITNLMLEKEENVEEGKTCEKLTGNIEFKNVDFSYGDNKVLKNLNMIIPEGKITAIVGPSGSGKTTILNLIERFYELDNDHIHIGSDDIRDFKLSEYRKTLGYITQETTLFAGTLRENLLYGAKSSYSDDELIEILKKVGIEDIVAENELGLDQPVGEGGENFSGGQRQRITIASMLTKKPDYLLMDEATAAIDISGKDEVFSSIKELMSNKTIVFVAHDIQTVKKADNIIVIENGTLMASGTYSEVSAENDFLRELSEEEE